MRNDFVPPARIEPRNPKVSASAGRKLELPQISSSRWRPGWDGLVAVVSRSINRLTHFGRASGIPTRQRTKQRSSWQSRALLRAGINTMFESLEQRTVFAVDLNAGDIAFTGIQSDDPDAFSFVLLKTVDTTTTLTFTDNGWATTQDGFANTTETTATITFGSNYTAGTQFVVINNETTPASATFRLAGTTTAAGSITGSLTGLSTSGDSILAYQGTAPTAGMATNWVAGINTLPWGASSGPNFSALPTALTNGVNAISFGSQQIDNGALNLANVTGVVSAIRSSVNTLANWTTSDSSLPVFPLTTSFTVTAGANVAPVNTVPGSQVGKADTPLIFSAANGNAISIADSDAGSNTVRVTLSATQGTLSLNGIAGLTFTAGDGTADATQTFTGTIAAINTALNGLSFTPTTGYTGAASLQIVTDDLGNSGSGGALSDTDNVALTIVPNILLNEIKANPPGSDTAGDRYQYLELRGTPGMSLNGVSLAMLDGSGASVGSADYVINLTGQTIGSNGLLLIKSDTGGHAASVGTTVVTDAALFDSVQGGTLSKTAVTFVLGYSTSGFVTGTDYDTDDNGTLDNLPSGLTILDNVGWVDGDTSGVVYGGVALTQSAGTPDAATRYNTNNSTTTAAWFNGDLYDVGNDPTQLLYDVTRRSTIFPSTPLVASLTPGGINFSEPPIIATNDGLTVTTGTLANAITDTKLRATDFEQTATQLIYTVTTLPLSGSLKLNGIAVVVNTTTFTQADIAAGKLTYDAPNLPGSGGFSFSISDGTHTINGTFAITVNNAVDTTLRIVSYNIASSGGTGTPRAGLETILQALSAETYNGVQEQVDLFVLQEVRSQATTSQWIVDQLNGVYGAGTYARGTLNGYTSGAGTQGVVYNTQTLLLQNEIFVGAAGGASRQTLRHQFQPIGSLSNSVFYVYNSHLKASDTPADELQRAGEVQVIRDNADSLGAGVNIIYAGDFNVYNSSEAGYQEFLSAGNGQAVDPLNRPGNWSNNASFKDIFTQAPSVVSVDGMTGGGLDDRFDFQLVTSELDDNVGLEYLNSSYRTFGNNGSVALNGNISDPGSTALAGLGNRTTVLDLLRTVTDHLPVVAEYTFAANGNSAPTIAAQSFSIAENTANGTIVGTVVASDVDVGDTKTFSITAGNNLGALSINATTGVLTVADTTKLDFETTPSFSLTVRVTDSAGFIASNTVTVNLTNVAEGPVLAAQSFTVFENAANSTIVGTLVATPDTGRTLTFALLGGNGSGGGAFAIHPNTGVITVADQLQLNFESTPSFPLAVQATDNQGATASATVTISLANVNESPSGTDKSVLAFKNTAYTFIASDFGFSDVDLPANILAAVTITTLPLNSAGVLSNNNVLVTAGQSISAADLIAGKLKFTPATDATGTTSFTFQVQDNGGITNGGVDLDPTPNQLSINVAAPFALGDIVFTGYQATTTDKVSLVLLKDVESGAVLTITDNAWTGSVLNATEGTSVLTFNLNFSAGTQLNYDALRTAGSRWAVGVSSTGLSETTVSGFALNASGDNLFAYNGTVAPVTGGDAGWIAAFATNSFLTTGSATASLTYLPAAFTLGANSFSLGLAVNAANENGALIGLGPTFVGTPEFIRTNVNLLSNWTSFTTAGGQAIPPATSFALDQLPTAISLSNASLAEDTGIGSVVGTFNTTDADVGQVFTYSLVSGLGSTDNAAFTIENLAGIGTLKTAISFDYETKSSYSIRVRTDDGHGGSFEEILVITVTDVTENTAPTSLILSNDEVAENVAGGFTIGSFTTTDTVGDTFTYTLVSGTGSTDNAAFTITGNALTINAGPNFELKSSYSIRVRTTDQSGLFIEQTFTVNVTDVNEAPSFGSPSYTFSLPENSAANTAVGTASVTDPDASASLIYSLTGMGASNFVISSTGAITVATGAVLNFETTPSFSLTAQVFDGTNSVTVPVTINLSNVNEAPSFGSVSYTFSLPENSIAGTAVGTASATDVDAGTTLTYSLAGSGAANFVISSTGAITVATGAVLDFETTPSFTLTAQVSDGTNIVTVPVTINLTNANEAPTIAPQSFSINNLSLVGATVGTVIATDPEAGTLTYSIPTTGTPFAIDSATGVLTIANPSLLPLLPKNTPSTTATVLVTVTDNGSPTGTSSALITVSLAAANRQGPVVAAQLFTIAENNKALAKVGTVKPLASYKGQKFVGYAISGPQSASFDFSAKGDITVKSGVTLNFETKSSYTFQVTVADSLDLLKTTTANVTIAVADVNEASALSLKNGTDDNVPLVKGAGTITIAENIPGGTTVNGYKIGNFSATDVDAGTTLDYALVKGTKDSGTGVWTDLTGAISWDPSTGDITVKEASLLSYEKFKSIKLNFTVTDDAIAGDAKSKAIVSKATVTIALSDLNEAPVITSASSFLIKENNKALATVGTVKATDPDKALKQTLTYSIRSQLDKNFTPLATNIFEIDSAKGALKVTAANALNFEANDTYTIVVRVTDSGTPGLFREQTITINVGDVNELPTFSIAANPTKAVLGATDPIKGTAALTISLSNTTLGSALALNDVLGTLLIADQDLDVTLTGTGRVNLTMTSDSVKTGLSYNVLTGAISITDLSKLVMGKTYALTVQAQDGLTDKPLKRTFKISIIVTL